MSTWLTSHLRAPFTIATWKMLFGPNLLRWANTSVPVKFSRLATIARALVLLIGKSSLHRRFVLSLRMDLEALRQTGRPMLTPGTMTEFTILLLALSVDLHVPLEIDLAELANGLCALLKTHRLWVVRV